MSDFQVTNQKTGDFHEFEAPEDVVEFLLGHMRDRGYYVLQYDDVHWTDGDGRKWTAKGDYILIHALAQVPFPMFPGMVLRESPEHVL